MTVRVKVCGIRRREDAELAVDLGAWALGFIFHPPSPRAIEPADAAAIVRELPIGVEKVGVFVDRDREEVERIAREVGLSLVQLHGRESPEYCAAVTGARVLKALRVGKEFDPALVEKYTRWAILLDTYRPGLPGGTGETFDWTVARDIGRTTPVLLAGGLGPENVAEAIRTAAPLGVDVSSGVESAPGVKDHDRLRKLFDEVRAAS